MFQCFNSLYVFNSQLKTREKGKCYPYNTRIGYTNINYSQIHDRHLVSTFQCVGNLMPYKSTKGRGNPPLLYAMYSAKARSMQYTAAAVPAAETFQFTHYNY